MKREKEYCVVCGILLREHIPFLEEPKYLEFKEGKVCLQCASVKRKS